MEQILLHIVQDSLDTNGIAYRVFACDPELADTATFCEKYGFNANQSANTIIVATKAEPKQFACCVVLATTKLDVNKKVRQLLESKKVSLHQWMKRCDFHKWSMVA